MKRKLLESSQPNQQNHQSLPKLSDAKIHSSLQPIALASLWQGVTVNEKDIEQVREMMWTGFGEMPNE